MNDADAAKRLLEPSFDPAREVLLQDVDDPGSLPPSTTTGADAASTASANVEAGGPPDEIAIDADVPGNGYVVLADTYYPGWTADVDGRPTAMYRANLSIRAIPVTAGRHRIHLSYAPPGWRSGAAGSVLSVGALLLWFVIGRSRAR